MRACAGGEALLSVRGHNAVEGVQCADVPVGAVGSQVQDEGYRRGPEAEGGVRAVC